MRLVYDGNLIKVHRNVSGVDPCEKYIEPNTIIRTGTKEAMP